MDDATLYPGPDESQAAGVDLRRIVQQLEPALGQVGEDPVPLAGGITNRNYRARFGEREYVIRVPGKDTGLLGIDRDAERLANERAAEIGIAPPVAAMLTDPPAIVTVFVAGRGMSAEELREPAALLQVARSLCAFHELGEPLATSFDSFRIVEEYAELAGERGAMIPAAYWEAHEVARRIEAALTGPEHEPVPCHNDLLAGNFIAGEPVEPAREGQLWIVDWEYAGMGNRYFDLANFAVNNELSEEQQEALLRDYFGPDGASESRFAALRLFRFMSDFREAMWGLLQGTVSDLDFDFAGYSHTHFDRLARDRGRRALRRLDRNNSRHVLGFASGRAR